jgi:hypothetical protein
MAGPDMRLLRDDGVLRARIEAANADPLEFDITIKLVTVEREWDCETYQTTFPIIEVEGYQAHDMYRFATPGTSWSEDCVIAETAVKSVSIPAALDGHTPETE